LALLAVTGSAFISAAPDQYFYNDAFYIKAGGVLLLALNAGFFYLCEYGTVKRMPADAEATGRQKLIAAMSLVLFAVVMCAGRMLTFFRPPGYF
jgi:uncharacterized membrane-anchored protein